MNIIETRKLSKTYRRVVKQEGIGGSIKSLFHREYEEKRAVEGMDFSVREGEFVGLIGPNGAGKTTLIKMLTGIIAPSSGEVEVMGYYPNDLKNDFKRQYAIVMGQKSQLFFELTTNDTLRLFKEIYGLGEGEFRETKAYFTELFGVEELLDVQVRTLSLGERMKMELMAALLHNPRVLFLDEPTIGLDAVASRQIRRFLREINQERGTTILLTSHYMEDIRALCDHSVVINHGHKIFDGDTEALFDKYQRDRQVTLSFDRAVERVELPENAVMTEETPYKKSIRIPREESGLLLQKMMEYHPVDVMVEEEEIGSIVERIYAESGVAGCGERPEPGRKATALQGGTKHSGTKHSGTKHSGAKHSGTKHSGAKHSGTKQSGMKQSGTKQDGEKHNREKHSGGAGTEQRGV